MNRQLFVFATVVAVVNARAGRQGWGSSTTTTTVPPPTTGWPAPPPSSPGWSAPSAISTSVEASADLAAAGSGWAASTQDAELLASSNTPDSEDPSQVSQLGYIGQYTGNNPEIVLGVQVADVNQVAVASQGIDATLLGGNYASAAVNGWSGAAGEATSSADASLSIHVNKP